MRTWTARWGTTIIVVVLVTAAVVLVVSLTKRPQTVGAENHRSIYENVSVTRAAAASPTLVSTLRGAVDTVPDGAVSIAVFDQEDGTALVDYQGDLRFPAESVVKLLIAMDDLDRGGDPDRDVEMLSRSDDLTASHLWVANGETQVVTRMAGIIGLASTTPPGNPGRWGDTLTTANDLVKIYQYLLNRAPVRERQYILHALHSATHYGADGFDQYFGIPDAAGNRSWGVKQGWACCKPSRVLNTTGLLDDDQRYIFVVLTSHPASTTWEQDEAEITGVVRALLTALPR